MRDAVDDVDVEAGIAEEDAIQAVAEDSSKAAIHT